MADMRSILTYLKKLLSREVIETNHISLANKIVTKDNKNLWDTGDEEDRLNEEWENTVKETGKPLLATLNMLLENEDKVIEKNNKRSNENQRKFLLEDVKAWNIWRKDNPEVKVRLTGANLRHADLMGADLNRSKLMDACLYGANLKEANFYGARLNNADFSNTNLQDVCFQKAILDNVNFSNAYLYGADLKYAELRGVNFNGADLSGVDLREANLSGSDLFNVILKDAKLNKAILSETSFKEADLSGANLTGSVLRNANLHMAKLTRANLSGANLTRVILSKALLNEADLHEADLHEANCYRTDFSNANLTRANLQNAVLVETNLDKALLFGGKIYGLSVWALKGTPNDQSSLIITPENEAIITVDDLKLGQFIYMLLNNENVRNVIDTITSKSVLILGRFTPERKDVLDLIRKELRKFDYVPILFDFTNTQNQSILETVLTLAGMSRFIIADVTDATMVREEIRSIVEKFPSKPIQPILFYTSKEYVTLPEIKLGFNSLLDAYVYNNHEEIVSNLKQSIIHPAELWIEARKSQILANPKTIREIELEKENAALKKKLSEINQLPK